MSPDVANLAKVPTVHGSDKHDETVLDTIHKILAHLTRFKGVFWFNNHWLPAGMLEEWKYQTGSITYASDNVGLATGATSGSYASVRKNAFGLTQSRTWDKRRLMSVEVYFSTRTQQNVHISTGDILDFTTPGNAERHVGFKLIDNILYGTVGNGTAESTLQLETLTASVYRALELDYKPGVECRFYVNGVDKGAITTNLPSGTLYAHFMVWASIHNKEAASKVLQIFEARTFQEE